MKPVLLTIDLQKDFQNRFTLLKQKGPFEKSIAELAAFFRERALPIVHFLTVHKKDKSTWTLHMKRDNFRICMEGSDGAKELPAVGRLPEEPVIYKTRWSAFYETGLDALLMREGYDTLVLAGFLTHACIRVTAIDAYQRDYKVIIAGDCVDTYDRVHEQVTLNYLSRYAAEVLSNKELMGRLDEWRVTDDKYRVAQ
jgi:nicotinamidase-related amidase